jgi:amino acid adenylation domain-containing protein
LSNTLASPLKSLPIAEQLFASSRRWFDRTLYTSSSVDLTYGEACSRMLKVAAWLGQCHGVKPGQRVALCLPTNISAAQVMLGVLAAGASYMPVQFNGPAERRDAIIKSFDPHLIVTTEAVAKRLRLGLDGTFEARIASVGPDDDALAAALSAVTPLARPVCVDSESLAAVYFTSGSTGEPKGVMFSHRGMAAALVGTMAHAELNIDDRMISVAGLHYVASLKLFNPMAIGCQCHVATDEEMMFPQRLAEMMEHRRTTIWHATTTQLCQLVERGAIESRDLTSLRGVRLVGERIPITVLQRAMDLLSGAKFQNRYGASEAIGMLFYDVPRPIPPDLDDLPLGQPIACFELSLRDDDGREVAPGKTGEICAVGAGVLMGYWNRPDLSAAVRIAGNPLSYRTGDLAYVDRDGNYRFAGRRDHQVKIRGHRFELGEIEAVLKSHPAVREAVAFVVSNGGAGQDICAYLLARPAGDLVAEVAAICSRRLPGFAKPAHVIVLEEFPRLSSGKIDRMALQGMR